MPGRLPSAGRAKSSGLSSSSHADAASGGLGTHLFIEQFLCEDFLTSSFLMGIVADEHYGAPSEGQVAVPLALSIHQLSEEV